MNITTLETPVKKEAGVKIFVPEELLSMSGAAVIPYMDKQGDFVVPQNTSHGVDLFKDNAYVSRAPVEAGVVKGRQLKNYFQTVKVANCTAVLSMN